MTKKKSIEEIRAEIISDICACWAGFSPDEKEAGKQMDALIKAVRKETLTCKYCGQVFDTLYCDCGAFNDE